MRGAVVLGGAITAGFALSGPLAGNAQADEVTELIESIRVAVERFEDVNVALAEGYIPDPSGECVMAGAHGLHAELGGMGIHYLHPGLLGITATGPRVDGTGIHTDFLEPAILLYEPREDDSLVLVGVENLVFRKAWEEAGHTEAPSFADRSWDPMADDPATELDEAHGFEPHYDQHVWFVDNSNGSLAPFNPSVTCAHSAL
ncbi:hypothetical protein QLQ85_20185 [Halomonas sp. M4R5S39]|uniref:hypothetical protein n=1 Tax=Halomonas kalidii TaxID=3043293 RepID=UPI0024A7B8FF|nr:hypothetical protein [Halomonas kalidii]MDI5987110.1 hypothetical protein [Halomonas kalidii]